MSEKNHYRKVFKSDHLGQADLEEFIEEGKRLVFTIERVQQFELVAGDKNSGVSVAGRRISANIAYFKEKGVKPMVLNSTNSKIIRSFANSPFVEDWKNVLIELYIDENVKMKGDTVGGVRIRQKQPTVSKPKLTKDHPHWAKVEEKIKEGVKYEDITKHYSLDKKLFDSVC